MTIQVSVKEKQNLTVSKWHCFGWSLGYHNDSSSSVALCSILFTLAFWARINWKSVNITIFKNKSMLDQANNKSIIFTNLKFLRHQLLKQSPRCTTLDYAHRKHVTQSDTPLSVISKETRASFTPTLHFLPWMCADLVIVRTHVACFVLFHAKRFTCNQILSALR